MKVLNFTAKEILPSLLDKTKKQTIRPAWHNRLAYVKDYKSVEKPARFKVGEKVKLMWGQRSKYKWFCKCCGKFRPQGYDGYCPVNHKKNGTFNKELGTAEITEVFKVTMSTGRGIEGTNHTMLEISTLDGFKSLELMRKYFDDNYDLSNPKEFWVYRWRHI